MVINFLRIVYCHRFFIISSFTKRGIICFIKMPEALLLWQKGNWEKYVSNALQVKGKDRYLYHNYTLTYLCVYIDIYIYHNQIK